MKTLFTLLIAVATWGYASAQNTDYSDKLKQGTGAAADTSASKFIIKAMKSSAMEIEAGRMAQQRAQSADVKAYGGRMIADHTRASNELRPIALKRKVDLSTIDNQKAMGSVANNSGTNVDTGAATTTGTAASTSTGNNQTPRSAGTTASTGTTGTTATSTGNNQTTRSAGTTTPTGTTGTTTNTSKGNDQTTRSAVTTATTNSTTNTSGNVNSTTNAGKTVSTGNNVNFDSNTHAGKADTDTSKNVSHEEKLNLLKQKSGAEFDREYMQMMVNDHTKAVQMFEKASNYTDAEVRAFAAKNLPVLREHLTSAQKILSSLESTNQSGNKSGNDNK